MHLKPDEYKTDFLKFTPQNNENFRDKDKNQNLPELPEERPLLQFNILIT